MVNDTKHYRTDAEQVVSSTYNMQQSTVWLTRNNIHYQERKMLNRGHKQSIEVYNCRTAMNGMVDASPRQLGVDSQLHYRVPIVPRLAPDRSFQRVSIGSEDIYVHTAVTWW